jgi:hypothetical protein
MSDSDRADAGRRDHARFPENDIGDKLYQAMLRGRAPDQPHEIDFAFLFSKKLDAEAFMARLAERGHEPEIEHLPEEEGEIEEWEVLTTQDMLSSHDIVAARLAELTALAEHHRGKLAYWIP